MELLTSRYRNLTVLAALLFVQVLGLAVQVKRSSEDTPTRLIRIWAVESVTPLEKAIVGLQSGAGGLWHNYFYLRGVRQENRDLKQKIEQLEIERARLSEDAEQAHRLQALLDFKEEFIAKTVAAQVIGSSGSEQSRSIYIDKGARDGIKPEMAVITADGIVGKVLRTFKTTSQVLLIDDQTSGVGAILEKTRLQGVLRGTPAGEVVLEKVMSDEAIQPGEKVLTSGGDRIFPKGLPVGTVTKVASGPEFFLNIRVKPSTNLSRLEEVLVITQQEERQPAASNEGHVRAADILAQRLPSVPEKPANAPSPKPNTTGAAIPGQRAGTNLKPGTGAVHLVDETASTPRVTKTAVPGPGAKPATASAPADVVKGAGGQAKPVSAPQPQLSQPPMTPPPARDEPQ